jgi:hypothetical protein
MALKAKKKEADVWAEAVKKEPDPDKEFVKLVAGRTRWYRIVWYVILGLLVYLIMTIGSMPPPKPPIKPDFNPSGKQAAYQQVESWLGSGSPLGGPASIVSWNGAQALQVSGDTSNKAFTAMRHTMTVQGQDGRWWTVDAVIGPGGQPIGNPAATPLSAPVSVASGAGAGHSWPSSIKQYAPSGAASRLLTNWGNALFGSDRSLLTTIVADPNPGASYMPLSLGGADSVTVNNGAYLDRGKVARDKSSSDTAVVSVTITAKAPDDTSQGARFDYDVILRDPDGTPKILAWGPAGTGPGVKDYANRWSGPAPAKPKGASDSASPAPLDASTDPDASSDSSD